MQRRNGEHWAGRLYMRAISLRTTRVLVNSPISPNGYTHLMIVAGGSAFARDRQQTLAAGATYVPSTLSEAKEDFLTQRKAARRKAGCEASKARATRSSSSSRNVQVT